MECLVCLGTITEEFTVRVLLNCKHMFHVECIDTWLGSHTTYPIYSSRVEPRVQELCIRVQPMAPPLNENASISVAQAKKESGLLGSFARIQSSGDEVFDTRDLERQ
ncbi:hypothetical protein J1N35_031112 [Gossypium stocksii]|uniref:RING-type domain-containing protein n=1 Tax=Gossypium stocksii TaxID=47602 RepID=A0A9D3V1C0_9ROSI|nr:hypothetical protein J1N35_031112 [Gossypium stocksii]